MNRILILGLLVGVCTLIAIFSSVLVLTGSTCPNCECPQCPEIPQWCSSIIPMQEKGGYVLRGDANKYMNMANVEVSDQYIKHMDHIYLKPGSSIKINNSFVERGTVGCIVNRDKAHQCSISCQTQNITDQI